MAAKRISILIIIVILIAAGIGAAYVAQSRLRLARLEEAERFAATYSALAFARERMGAYPDSLAAAYDSIYAAHGTDSSWMSDYAATLPENVYFGSRTWDRIVAKLDSLRDPNRAYPDTMMVEDEQY